MAEEGGEGGEGKPNSNRYACYHLENDLMFLFLDSDETGIGQSSGGIFSSELERAFSYV